MLYFSVIIPCYNGEKTIERAMQSVIDQTYKNYELVIVDNGSTDKTEETVKAFIDKNPQADIKLFSQENRGISGSRNRGIKESTYEYISLLDADDLWYKNKLEVVSGYIEKYKNIDIFSHNEMIVTSSSKRMTNPRDLKEPFFTNLLLEGNCLSPSAVTVKKEALLKIGCFDMNCTGGQEDYDCWLRLAKSGAKFKIIPEVLGEFIITGENISCNYEEHGKVVLEMVMSYFKKACDEKIIPDNLAPFYEKLLCSRHLYSIGRSHSSAGRGKDARQMFIKAIKESPSFWKPYVAYILSFGSKKNAKN
ncbi:MAG: glycosyltransferase [Synergistaceae bacterium]